MTQKERIEQIEKEIVVLDKAVKGMRDGRIALVQEWKVYEDAYKEYLARKNRIRNFLWRLFCKITLRDTKLTEKELNKYTAKKLARIFYKRNRR